MKKLVSVAIQSVFILLWLFSPAAAKCTDNAHRDVNAFYEKIDHLIKNNLLFTQTTLGTVFQDNNAYEIKLISYRPSESSKYNVFIIGGLHGDEPAGPESIFEYILKIVKNPAMYADFNIDFIPLANPTGWHDCNRYTSQNHDVNREYHLLRGQEVKILNNFLSNKRYDLMIDHHEDPREHVDAFYIVTYANKNLKPLQKILTAVNANGYKLREFRHTKGFLNIKKRKMDELKNKTFMLYARKKHSESVYQIETPTTMELEERIKLQNLANDILMKELTRKHL